VQRAISTGRAAGLAAKHGVPCAIAALKGEMSPEVKKATATAKAMLKKERHGHSE
jgi:hypothetical protein